MTPERETVGRLTVTEAHMVKSWRVDDNFTFLRIANRWGYYRHGDGRGWNQLHGEALCEEAAGVLGEPVE